MYVTFTILYRQSNKKINNIVYIKKKNRTSQHKTLFVPTLISLRKTTNLNSLNGVHMLRQVNKKNNLIYDKIGVGR